MNRLEHARMTVARILMARILVALGIAVGVAGLFFPLTSYYLPLTVAGLLTACIAYLLLPRREG